MRGPGVKLTRKQEVAIAVLLTALRIAEAGDTASISDPPLWCWLQREDFQIAYRRQARGGLTSRGFSAGGWLAEPSTT